MKIIYKKKKKKRKKKERKKERKKEERKTAGQYVFYLTNGKGDNTKLYLPLRNYVIYVATLNMAYL